MSGGVKGWYDRIQPGDRLACLSNEVWSPEKFLRSLDGRVFEYVSGKNSIRLRPEGSTTDNFFWITRPKARDVVTMTDNEITYVIRDQKTCTWRYLGAAS